MGSSLTVGDFEARITSVQWKAIQKAYGPDIAFDDATKAHISSQITRYLQEAAMERNAPSADDARNLLSKYQKKAKQFHTLLTTWPELNSPARGAMIDVRAHVTVGLLHVFESSPLDIGKFAEMLEGFVAACDRAKKSLEASIAYDSFVEGEGWEAMVCSLTNFAHQRGLPTGAAKDSDKRNEPSPFVRFIMALMATMPVEAQRHGKSWQACAQAISIARRVVAKRERIASSKTG